MSARRFVFFAIFVTLLTKPAHAILLGNSDHIMQRHAVMVLDDRSNMCTGVVLSQSVIITAAHCVTNATAWRVHWRDADNLPVLAEPASIKVHPEFTPSALKTRSSLVDLAIITLKEPLPDIFVAVSLTKSDSFPVGTAMVIGGYGRTDEKKPKSIGKFFSAFVNVVEPFGPSKKIIWLEDPAKSGVGGCHGDSGGPIMAGDELVAVLFWTSGNGRSQCGALTQGILLAPHREWILKAAGFTP